MNIFSFGRLPSVNVKEGNIFDQGMIRNTNRKMDKIFADLPGWSFEIEEVSHGVYEVIGSDQKGHQVQAKGTDVDVLLQECHASALRIQLPLNSE